MYRLQTNYASTLLWIWLLLALCCVPPQLGTANTDTQEPPDLRQAPAYIARTEYYLNATPIEPPNIFGGRTLVYTGDPYSRYAVQQSIKALYATQQYSQIQVYAQETADGIVLIYQLTPFDRIKEVAIIGVQDIGFRSALENVMQSKMGGRYIPTIANADIQRMERVCQAYGYFNAEITGGETLTEDRTLTYQITLGTPTSIKKLHVQGNAALATNTLKHVCKFSLLSPIYNKVDVESDIAAMLALYQKNNYPAVNIASSFFHETGTLRFHINEGQKVHLNFLETPVSLQETFSDDIIRLLVETSSATMWERRIKSYFEVMGYHDTTVSKETPDPLSVRLTINPGTRYTVKSVNFSGNRAFSDTQLLREMTMKPIDGFLRNLFRGIVERLLQQEQGTFFSQLELETDMNRLKILYAKSGYPNVTISSELNEQKPDTGNIGEVEINIAIVEAHKEMIHRCDISGNSAIDTETLLIQLQTELSLPQPNVSLARKVYSDAILRTYYEIGYIDAKVSDTYVPETETPVFRMDGDFTAPLAEGQLPPEIRTAFRQHDFTLTGVYIAAYIGNTWSLQDAEGNPRYTLKQRETHLEVFEHGVLRLTVDAEGQQISFGKFYFQGDTDVVKPHVLEREVSHLQGTLWTSKKLSTALQNLYSLGLFHSIRQERLLQGESMQTETAGTSENTSDVLITVEKQLPRTYSISGGYSFAEGVRGTLALTDSNFLVQRNIRGRVRGRLGWRDELSYLFDATLTEPWFIGRTRASLQVLAKKLEVDDNVRALQGSFILSRDLSQSHNLDLRYSYRDLNQPVSDASIPTPPPEAPNPFRTTVSSVQLSWTYDSRVRYLNPTTGILNALTLEYAGGVLQGETSFIKTTADTRYYQKLIGGLVLATAVRFGITTGLRSNRQAELISFERFWAGGGTTVRGYAERSLGPRDSTGTHRGDVQFIFNTELRFPIYWWIRGAIFFDAGNVWRAWEDIDTSAQLPSSVGAGLYLDLGALTAGIDYAIPFASIPGALGPDRAFHVRLGSTF